MPLTMVVDNSYINRMMIERDQLDRRIRKCSFFVTSAAYAGLDKVEQDDLVKQLSAMRSYYSILCRRIQRAVV